MLVSLTERNINSYSRHIHFERVTCINSWIIFQKGREEVKENHIQKREEVQN